MKNMGMHIFLSVLMLLLVTVTPGMVSAQTNVDPEIAHKFCMDILGQSKLDTSHCLIKPINYVIKDRDPAVLTYLCCLGHFKDVRYNYMPYVSRNLTMLIINSPSATNLVSVGTFIRKCSARKVKVTRSDYEFWRRNGKTQRACHDPYQK